MVNYSKYIKITRYLQKKSISELCDGICTPSTLSKIENNKSNISRDIINQILKKLSTIDISILEKNTNDLQQLVDLFTQKLVLNLDRTDLIKQINDMHDVFMYSEHILFYYIAKLYSNLDLYCISEGDIDEDIFNLIKNVIEFGNSNEIYFYNLLKVKRIKTTSNQIKSIKNYIEQDKYGWMCYFYCDALYHADKINEAYISTDQCYKLVCEKCNINLMYGCLLLLGLCSLKINDSNNSIKYFKRLENLAPFIKYDIQSTINYNLGATLLENKDIEKAKLYLEPLENKKYNFDLNSFFIIHKLAYLYTELRNHDKAKYYINWIIEFSNRQKNDISEILVKISESMMIKLNDSNYLNNKKYQNAIEFIFQNSPDIFSYGFQKFYLSDLESVYLAQRKYKDLYYLFKLK